MMGREVRRVPADWDHPKNDSGDYIPLLGGRFAAAADAWDEGAAKWGEGLRAKWTDSGDQWVPKDDHMTYSYQEWAGERPQERDYMPDWPEAERTHFQMYEDTSEGTPISPVMESPESLARWLADTGASAFASMTATYEQWLPICQCGFAPSMVIDNGTVKSGVAAMAEADNKTA